MKKKILIIVGLILLIILGIGIYKFNFTNSDIYLENGKQINTYDATYSIDGQQITLKNGLSEIAIPDSSAKIITKFWGNQIEHDLDDDGTLDNIFIITQETGGTGIFYYVVAKLNTKEGSKGSDAVFLGDRIAPQTISIDENKDRKNVIVVNYADRKENESFAISPSIGKSIWLKLDTQNMQFGEVAQNFEGEADPSKMTLDMKTWNWIKTIYNDDTTIIPKISNRFTITFKKDGTFSARTDCNGIGGNYSINENKITFGQMMSTQMYCEGSQENDFRKSLTETSSYMFTSKGELVLLLKYDSGSVIFK
ncbi:MAG: META domain-containing protein [Candidatus Absconditabacteria bacterium]|nr:META domain-containing protein [Candidatus Absconditabacteria bacterium]